MSRISRNRFFKHSFKPILGIESLKFLSDRLPAGKARLNGPGLPRTLNARMREISGNHFEEVGQTNPWIRALGISRTSLTNSFENKPLKTKFPLKEKLGLRRLYGRPRPGKPGPACGNALSISVAPVDKATCRLRRLRGHRLPDCCR